MHNTKLSKILGTIIITLIITLLSNMSFAQNIENKNVLLQNTERGLINFDLEERTMTREDYVTEINNLQQYSGEVINRTEPFTPEGSELVMPCDIIGGVDNRVPVSNPSSKICYIEVVFPNGKAYAGTAFMIYKNLALTAAHCVYNNSRGGFATTVNLYPGATSSSIPYSAYATNILIENRWAASHDVDEDWALLTLNSNIGDITGWEGIAYSNDYEVAFLNKMVRVTGYPGDLSRDQYTHRSYVRATTDRRLAYEVDTDNGPSGAPVYDDPGYAIGIHNGATGVNNILYNCCANINRDRFNTFVSKMQ